MPDDELPPAPPPSVGGATAAGAARSDHAGSAPTGEDLALALVGGLVGAIVGGIVWGYLLKATETELGIVAIGVGVLAGFGVALLARGKRGRAVPGDRRPAALVGILWGKYFGFVLVGRGFTDLFSGFDVAWIVFAVYTALPIPAGRASAGWCRACDEGNRPSRSTQTDLSHLSPEMGGSSSTGVRALGRRCR